MMTLQEAQRKMDDITDNLGMPIDEGIKEVLVGLWIRGVETTGSCEGHVNGGEPFPWVDIETSEPKDWNSNRKSMEAWRGANQKQANKLKTLLYIFNRQVSFPYPLKLVPRGMYGVVRLQTGRTKSIADTIPPDFLDELQEQMSAFSEFLLKSAKQ